jgi:hypothetical protein
MNTTIAVLQNSRGGADPGGTSDVQDQAALNADADESPSVQALLNQVLDQQLGSQGGSYSGAPSGPAAAPYPAATLSDQAAASQAGETSGTPDGQAQAAVAQPDTTGQTNPMPDQPVQQAASGPQPGPGAPVAQEGQPPQQDAADTAANQPAPGFFTTVGQDISDGCQQIVLCKMITTDVGNLYTQTKTAISGFPFPHFWYPGGVGTVGDSTKVIMDRVYQTAVPPNEQNGTDPSEPAPSPSPSPPPASQ